MSADISIIIPNLHSPIIDQVIGALCSQTAAQQIREIIVVGQDRYGLVPADVTFLRTERPISAAAARNRGAGHATGEYILFIDADCIASAGLIEHMLQAHQRGEQIVCGSVHLEARPYWTLCDNLLVFGPYLDTTPGGERAYVPSLNLSICRALFLDNGGFDECFPGAAGEDMDFSLRLRSKGHRLAFEPKATLIHRPARTSARRVWEHLRSFGRAHMRVQRRHQQLLPSVLNHLSWRWGPMLFVAAPFLAALDILKQVYLECPPQHLLPAIPGMIWARIGWYWGVGEGLMVLS